MADAELGDAILFECPTTERLQDSVARKLGKEAALFVPTGSMGNIAALIALGATWAEVICGRHDHIMNYEAGALGALVGCQPYPIDSPHGYITPEMIDQAARPPGNWLLPRQHILSIENTAQAFNGRPWRPAEVDAACSAARRHGLRVHVDGARIWNASVALGIGADRLVRDADTVMFCFSKGLSAPMGSIIAGPSNIIEKAIVSRKILGGQLHQSGVVAAAAQVAIDTMVDRLAEDHSNAQRLARGLADLGFDVRPEDCPTNIVTADVTPTGVGVETLCERAATYGIRVLPDMRGDRLRMVTHRHITPEKVRWTIESLERLVDPLAARQ